MHPNFGWFPESNFDLANESRLPNWFSLPNGLSREEVNIELLYYVPPPLFKSNVKAILIGPPPENKKLGTKIGIGKKVLPKTSKDRSQYPRYKIININGIEEVIEHRKMEPFYYVSDNPTLKKSLTSH